MNILFLCDGFNAPAFNPRVRYFCNFFLKKGYKIFIVAEKFAVENYIPENAKTLTIFYYRFSKSFWAKIEWFFKFILNIFFDHKGNFFYKKTLNFIKTEKIDIVICSTFYSFPLTTALKTANYKKLPLIVDMRDLPEQATNSNHLTKHKAPPIIEKFIANLYNNAHLKRRNKVLKKANHLTTISSWHFDFLKKYNSNISLIYNGFDENLFVPNVQKTDIFIISYFGRFYDNNLRNPDFFCKALKNLIEKKLISMDKIAVQWFSDEKTEKIVTKYAKKYEILAVMKFKMFIPPVQVPEQMNKSSILLLIENDEKQQTFGIFGTKIFEYIGVNRPVLCVPDNNGMLAQTLKKINCGLVSSDVAEIENFILEKYLEWQKNGFTENVLNEEVRLNFSRKKGAEILEKIFNKFIN